MAIPDWLAISGAVVGLVGGGVSVIDNTIGRAVRRDRAKRDAQVRIRVEFLGYLRHEGEPGHQYPLATATIHNDGRVPAKDIEVEASTGYGFIDTHMLGPDLNAIITFATAPVHEVERPADRGQVYWPDDVPTEPGPVKLTVTWRIDGTSERSEGQSFTHDYSAQSLG